MSFYVTISSEGEKGEVEQCTMHKYKLMPRFIVHCAIKSMYYTQLFYSGIMESEACEQKLLISE